MKHVGGLQRVMAMLAVRSVVEFIQLAAFLFSFSIQVGLAFPP